jgi:hypothetical protein
MVIFCMSKSSCFKFRFTAETHLPAGRRGER